MRLAVVKLERLVEVSRESNLRLVDSAAQHFLLQSSQHHFQPIQLLLLALPL